MRPTALREFSTEKGAFAGSSIIILKSASILVRRCWPGWRRKIRSLTSPSCAPTRRAKRISAGTARRVRPLGPRARQDVGGGRIDPSRAYRLRLASPRAINLFFYDGPIARAGWLKTGSRPRKAVSDSQGIGIPQSAFGPLCRGHLSPSQSSRASFEEYHCVCETEWRRLGGGGCSPVLRPDLCAARHSRWSGSLGHRDVDFASCGGSNDSSRRVYRGKLFRPREDQASSADLQCD